MNQPDRALYKVGDVNGDGIVDIVSIHEERLGYYAGIGDGNFADYVNIRYFYTICGSEDCPMTLTDLALYDVNNNGTLNIVIQARGSTKNEGNWINVMRTRMYTFNGSGFTEKVIVPPNCCKVYYERLGVGDLTGNGEADFITTSGNRLHALTQLNNNTPNNLGIDLENQYLGTQFQNLDLFDFNGDGISDVVLGPLQRGSIFPFFGTTDYFTDRGQDQFKHHMLLVQNTGEINTAEAIIEQSTIINNATHLSELLVVDLNNDGISEVVFSETTPTDVHFKVLRLNSQNNWVEHLLYTVPVTEAERIVLYSGDFNGDGHTDLLFLSQDGIGFKQYRVAYALNDGNSGFNNIIGPSLIGLTEKNFLDFAVADLNGDGIDDILLARKNAFLQVHEGQPSGIFNPNPVNLFSVGSALLNLKVANLNGTGTKSILTGRGGVVNVYTKNPQGTNYLLTQTLNLITNGRGSSDYRLADVNGDGRLDFLIFTTPSTPQASSLDITQFNLALILSAGAVSYTEIGLQSLQSRSLHPVHFGRVKPNGQSGIIAYDGEQMKRVTFEGQGPLVTEVIAENLTYPVRSIRVAPFAEAGTYNLMYSTGIGDAQLNYHYAIETAGMPPMVLSNVELPPVKHQLKVYPVPTSDMLYLEHNMSEGEMTATLLDLSGRVLRQVNVNNPNTSWSLSGLSSGIYVVQLTAEGRVIEHHKIVVEK